MSTHPHTNPLWLASFSVSQTGTIGVFDFPTLLMALVSSAALLAVAKTVVEVLAFNILPLKMIYK